MRIKLNQLKKIIRENLEVELEGRPGNWKYKIHNANDFKIKQDSGFESIKNVEMEVTSGPGNSKGFRFKLGDIEKREGPESYMNHPLVSQVFEVLMNDEDSFELGVSSGTEIDASKELPDTTTDKKFESLNFLFVGDSVIAGPHTFAAKILGGEYLNGKNKSEKSIDLETISRLLGQELGKNTYDVVTIVGGGNDSWRENASDVTGIYDQMYDAVRESGAIVVAVTNPTKVNASRRYRKTRPSNEELAAFVRNSNKWDVLIDANKIASESNYFASDGVHLNNTGHQKIAGVWMSKVKKFYDEKVDMEGPTPTPDIGTSNPKAVFYDPGHDDPGINPEFGEVRSGNLVDPLSPDLPL